MVVQPEQCSTSRHPELVRAASAFFVYVIAGKQTDCNMQMCEVHMANRQEENWLLIPGL